MIAQVLISAIGADQDKGYQGLAPETSLHSTSHAFSRTRVRKGSAALQGTTSLTEARQTAGRGLRDPMTEKPRQLASSVPRSRGFANQKGDMATNEYEPQDDDDEDEDEDDDDDDDDDDDEDDDDEGWSHA
ncbi:hypothetical protein BGZ98_002105 [Dissophora globulifera]|nr:hypothetical protein BGZ98_002105 [Dissophora globulifera]